MCVAGEGGTFALFQGLYPRHDADGCDEGPGVVRGRQWLDKVKWPLRIWSLFGTALTLSDGIFTSGGSTRHSLTSLAHKYSSHPSCLRYERREWHRSSETPCHQRHHSNLYSKSLLVARFKPHTDQVICLLRHFW